jgi:uncharacterized protein (DUF1499 family)
MSEAAPAPQQPWWSRLLNGFAWLVLAGAIGVLIGGQMGLFSGSRPQQLGFNAGKFAPCGWKPNCVNSTADAKSDAAHFIEPLRFATAPEAAWNKLAALVKATPRAQVVREDSAYLYAEFSSKLMGYTDDVEFALDAGGRQIHVRSASRLGVRDFGVNRARIEDLRARFGSGQ